MKPIPETDMIKTTIRAPRELWNRARHRAIEERMPVQDLLVKALELYLSKKGGRT